MTQYERLTRVLDGKKAPLAWYADLSWLYHARCETGAMDERYLGETECLQYHRDLKAGICFYAPTLWNSCMDERVRIESAVEGDLRSTTWATPNGNVRQVEKFLPSSHTWTIT